MRVMINTDSLIAGVLHRSGTTLDVSPDMANAIVGTGRGMHITEDVAAPAPARDLTDVADHE
ncbi:hypothetical protein [Sandarakinorhabdus sp.]|uniref:hypothetical protein n=1 Tax=Sandarakinorhabdus sp. TaxID=1916663 RepID=UPI0035669728